MQASACTAHQRVEPVSAFEVLMRNIGATKQEQQHVATNAKKSTTSKVIEEEVAAECLSAGLIAALHACKLIPKDQSTIVLCMRAHAQNVEAYT